jgi:hypothetical protein
LPQRVMVSLWQVYIIFLLNNMDENAVVIIADVRGSRKMAQNERYEGQLFLKSAIIQVNENLSDVIEAPFMITRGDEFQGVLRDLENAFLAMLEFERLLFPLQLRYGIGRGIIQKMGSKIPIEMDGPAFHRANQALTDVKKKKHFMYCHIENSQTDLMVNTILALIGAIKGRWNEVAFERYWKYKELGTFEKVAQTENVSTQAVWDSMQNMRTLEVLDAEKNLIQTFKYLDSIHR